MSREGRRMWKGQKRKEGEEMRGEDPLDFPPPENLATPLHVHEMVCCRVIRLVSKMACFPILYFLTPSLGWNPLEFLNETRGMGQ